jgi:signal transduction histidine kinase
MASGTYSNNYQGAVRMAGKVEASAKRLINMINGLLDMQKMEAGRLNMFLDVVDCSEIVDHCVDSLETLAQTSQITLTPFMGGDVQVLADRDYVIQVLVNLISNAIKFSPPGKSVDIRVEPNEKMVTIKVIDQGPGIGEEFRKRMFNRFEQAHISDQRVKGGTGLGLAIAKAIIEQHGGEIGVDSEEGFGSTFWFTLQRVQV